ncbi:hypothetical protein BT69DRAFT_1068136 [Atractiella rhizophila]|nr:hypothetical protein BT69DRAFT_1068136 [Atractiella rhizophila]
MPIGFGNNFSQEHFTSLNASEELETHESTSRKGARPDSSFHSSITTTFSPSNGGSSKRPDGHTSFSLVSQPNRAPGEDTPSEKAFDSFEPSSSSALRPSIPQMLNNNLSSLGEDRPVLIPALKQTKLQSSRTPSRPGSAAEDAGLRRVRFPNEPISQTWRFKRDESDKASSAASVLSNEGEEPTTPSSSSTASTSAIAGAVAAMNMYASLPSPGSRDGRSSLIPSLANSPAPPDPSNPLFNTASASAASPRPSTSRSSNPFGQSIPFSAGGPVRTPDLSHYLKRTDTPSSTGKTIPDMESPAIIASGLGAAAPGLGRASEIIRPASPFPGFGSPSRGALGGFASPRIGGLGSGRGRGEGMERNANFKQKLDQRFSSVISTSIASITQDSPSWHLDPPHPAFTLPSESISISSPSFNIDNHDPTTLMPKLTRLDQTQSHGSEKNKPIGTLSLMEKAILADLEQKSRELDGQRTIETTSPTAKAKRSSAASFRGARQDWDPKDFPLPHSPEPDEELAYSPRALGTKDFGAPTTSKTAQAQAAARETRKSILKNSSSAKSSITSTPHQQLQTTATSASASASAAAARRTRLDSIPPLDLNRDINPFEDLPRPQSSFVPPANPWASASVPPIPTRPEPTNDTPSRSPLPPPDQLPGQPPPETVAIDGAAADSKEEKDKTPPKELPISPPLSPRSETKVKSKSKGKTATVEVKEPTALPTTDSLPISPPRTPHVPDPPSIPAVENSNTKPMSGKGKKGKGKGKKDTAPNTPAPIASAPLPPHDSEEGKVQVPQEGGAEESGFSPVPTKKEKRKKKGVPAGTEDPPDPAADANANGEGGTSNPELSASVQDTVEETPKDGQGEEEPPVPELAASAQDKGEEAPEDIQVIQPEPESSATPLAEGAALIDEKKEEDQTPEDTVAQGTVGLEADGVEEDPAGDNWGGNSKKKKKAKKGMEEAASAPTSATQGSAEEATQEEVSLQVAKNEAEPEKVPPTKGMSKKDKKKQKKGKGGTESATTTRPSSPVPNDQDSPSDPTKITATDVLEVEGLDSGKPDERDVHDATTPVTGDGNAIGQEDTPFKTPGKKKKGKKEQTADTFGFTTPPTPSTPKTGITTPAAGDEALSDDLLKEGKVSEQVPATAEENQVSEAAEVAGTAEGASDVNVGPPTEPLSDSTPNVPLAFPEEANLAEGETTAESADDPTEPRSVDAPVENQSTHPPAAEDMAASIIIPVANDASELAPSHLDESAPLAAEGASELDPEVASTKEADTEPVEAAPPADVPVDQVALEHLQNEATQGTDAMIEPIPDPTTQDPKTNAAAASTVDEAVATDQRLDAAAENVATAVTKDEPNIEGEGKAGKGNKKKKDNKKKKGDKEQSEEVKALVLEKPLEDSGNAEGALQDIEKPGDNKSKKKPKKGKGQATATEDPQADAADLLPSPVPPIVDISTSANTPVQLPATPASGEQPLFPSMGAPVVAADPISPTSSVLHQRTHGSY